jgi:hypothetical protein
MAAKPQPLDEARVRAFRAELDAFIDARATEIGKTCPGVPVAAIRLSITRGMGCQCAAYLQLQAKDNAEAA